jgi:hypothetical protein
MTCQQDKFVIVAWAWLSRMQPEEFHDEANLSKAPELHCQHFVLSMQTLDFVMAPCWKQPEKQIIK